MVSLLNTELTLISQRTNDHKPAATVYYPVHKTLSCPLKKEYPGLSVRRWSLNAAISSTNCTEVLRKSKQENTQKSLFYQI